MKDYLLPGTFERCLIPLRGTWFFWEIPESFERYLNLLRGTWFQLQRLASVCLPLHVSAAHPLVCPAYPLDPAQRSSQTQSWCWASRSLKQGRPRRWWARGRICAQGRPRPCCPGPTTAGPPPTSPSQLQQLSHVCNQINFFLLKNPPFWRLFLPLFTS